MFWWSILLYHFTHFPSNKAHAIGVFIRLIEIFRHFLSNCFRVEKSPGIRDIFITVIDDHYDQDMGGKK